MSVTAHFIGGPRHGTDLELPTEHLVVNFPVLREIPWRDELHSTDPAYDVVAYERRGWLSDYVVYEYAGER